MIVIKTLKMKSMAWMNYEIQLNLMTWMKLIYHGNEIHYMDDTIPYGWK
jgi:hypothetical protein